MFHRLRERWSLIERGKRRANPFHKTKNVFIPSWRSCWTSWVPANRRNESNKDIKKRTPSPQSGYVRAISLSPCKTSQSVNQPCFAGVYSQVSLGCMGPLGLPSKTASGSEWRSPPWRAVQGHPSTARAAVLRLLLRRAEHADRRTARFLYCVEVHEYTGKERTRRARSGPKTALLPDAGGSAPRG